MSINKSIMRLRKLAGPQRVALAIHTEQVFEAGLFRCVGIQEKDAPRPISGGKSGPHLLAVILTASRGVVRSAKDRE
jgi:hypothetical protein